MKGKICLRDFGSHVLKFVLIVLTVSAVFGCTVGKASADSINYPSFSENSIIYQLLTDRFYDGDNSNNDQGAGEYIPGNLRYYQGGDWEGIIDKVSYISDLGATAIQISPPYRNEWRTGDGASYHGYYVKDFYSPDPHFGTLEELREMVDRAALENIAVILDAVPNHTADYLQSGDTAYHGQQPAPPFNNPDWYHHLGNISDWDNETQVVYNDLFGLDDLAQEKPEVENELNNVFKFWIENTHAAAYRVDAARHVYRDQANVDSYLGSFQSAVGVPAYGEVWKGDVGYVATFQNWLWGCEDFPLYFAVRDVFASDGSYTKLGDVLDRDNEYQNANRLVTFISNHDVGRFLYFAGGNQDRLELALSFLLTVRGVPKLYYGDEQGYSGGVDPACREVMENWDENRTLYQHIQRLCRIRMAYDALREGGQYQLWEDEHVYAYSRMTPTEEVIVVLTNSGPQEKTIPLRAESQLAAGDVLVNLLNTSENVVVREESGEKVITTSLGEREAKIYVKVNTVGDYPQPVNPPASGTPTPTTTTTPTIIPITTTTAQPTTTPPAEAPWAWIGVGIAIVIVIAFVALILRGSPE